MSSDTTDSRTTTHLARVRARWDANAEWWDDMSSRNATTADRAADLDRTKVALALESGASILDAGCGTGQFAIAFAERGLRVVALDLAPAMIQRAMAHGAVAGVDVDWRVGDLTSVAVEDGAFDAVHARMALQFVPDLPAALARIRAVLRPGGRLYASVPGALSPIYGRVWQRFLDPDFDMAYVTPRDLERLLDHLGWEILDQWGEFGQSAESAGVDAAAAVRLSVPLQQAAATTWAIIAR
jgi:SAM-dependent methyltransferase